MKKVFVFAGTTEGRIFAKKCADEGFSVTVSVATDYGKEILEDFGTENLCVQSGRLSECEMIKSVSDFDFVVDATHPFAVEVSKNIQSACEKCGKKVFRLLRSDSEEQIHVAFFDSISEICDELSKLNVDDNIFISTGSKELEPFTKIPDFQNRCFVRVLPTVDSIQRCLDFGFKTKNIIAMQGPFSVLLNEAMFRETEAKILVTKESGKIGGFDEKIEAAKKCGMKIFSVRRPKENGENIFSDMEKLLAAIYFYCHTDLPNPTDCAKKEFVRAVTVGKRKSV